MVSRRYIFVRLRFERQRIAQSCFSDPRKNHVTGQKDAKGKLFHNEIIETAETKGSGWVDYMFPKPGKTEPSQKWTYVKKVTVDGIPALVASGFYPE